MNETFLSRLGSPFWEEQWSPRAMMSIESVPYVLGLLLVMWTTYAWTTSNSTLNKLPHINSLGFFSGNEAKKEWRASAKTLLQRARKQFPNQPYRMRTEWGNVLMLQSEWFPEIRNDAHFSFIGTFSQERICEIPGFQPLSAFGKDGKILQAVAKNQLTKHAGQVTAPLSEEISFAVSLNIGESPEWREMTLMPAVYDITTRMSSRVFLGEALARNEDWLDVSKNYAIELLKSIDELTKYPKDLRPYIGWMFPSVKRVQGYYARATSLIDPIMKQREATKQAAIAAGEPVPKFNDVLEWVAQEAKVQGMRTDATTCQLTLSLVAIATTADLLHCVMLDLIQHPEYIQALREEIVQALRADGWTKTSLYNMKLLDSVLKETQRVKPFFTALRRSVDADTKLSDGTVLKKGSRVHIDMHRMVDQNVYPDPEEWRGDRFLKLRSQPGKENLAQLVTVSADHFAFGLGEHACPGRFFAANETKIALCHLLLKYDWELAPGTSLDIQLLGFNQRSNTNAKVLCRRRKTVEFDIDSI
ncbi:cytochrome P450 monooxygenase [Nemania sp. FL0916]|nr:cytochrome P450 monooxygenase [Nemania sp. FL0916]